MTVGRTSQPVEDLDRVPFLRVLADSLLAPFRHPIMLVGNVALVAGLAVSLFIFLKQSNPDFADEALSIQLFLENPMLFMRGIWASLGVFLFSLLLTFVFWVRVGALEDARAWKISPLAWGKALMVSGFHLLWIIIVIYFLFSLIFGVVMMLVLAVLSGAGLMSDMEAMIESPTGGAFTWVPVATVPLTWLIFFLYARFSMLIVRAALGEETYDFKYPDKPGYVGALSLSLVLLLAYVAGSAAQIAIEYLPLEGPLALASVIGAIALYLYGIMVIGAAHGAAFRLKAGALGPSEDVARTDI